MEFRRPHAYDLKSLFKLTHQAHKLTKSEKSPIVSVKKAFLIETTTKRIL